MAREQNTAKRNPRKRKKADLIVIVDVKKLVRLLIVFVMTALVAFAALQVIKRFLPVKEFSVQGISVYESTDIINASGVKRGDLLYALDEKELASRVLQKCPYLADVKVKAVFPNELRFEVTGRNVRWYMDVSGTLYALDNDLVVLDEIGKPDGLTKLVLPNVKRVLCGSVPQFSESETELKKTLEVISEIRKSALQSRLTEVNLESRWSIQLVVDGTFTVTLGDMSDLASKLLAAEEILLRNLPKNCIGGALDVSIPQHPAFKPIYEDSVSE